MPLIKSNEKLALFCINHSWHSSDSEISTMTNCGVAAIILVDPNKPALYKNTIALTTYVCTCCHYTELYSGIHHSKDSNENNS